jgi:hypothetical protein
VLERGFIELEIYTGIFIGLSEIKVHVVCKKKGKYIDTFIINAGYSQK